MGQALSDEDVETVIRGMIAATRDRGALETISDLGSLLWCFLVEQDDDETRAAVLRVGKRIYLEARVRQVSPDPS